MTQIDFVIAFVLIITIIYFAISFVSSNFSNELSVFETNELKESASSLQRYLFEMLDDKSLVTDAKKIKILFKEVGGYDHPEQMNISIEPLVNKVHVYDNFMNEISSESSIIGNKILVSFWLGFSRNEEKRINIFYFGDPTTHIEYLSFNNNITSRILSEEKIIVVSKEKCSKLKSLEYEDVKNMFGFDHQFKINLTDCNYGPEPPEAANVIVKSIPLLIENPNELISSGNAKIMVW